MIGAKMTQVEKDEKSLIAAMLRYHAAEEVLWKAEIELRFARLEYSFAMEIWGESRLQELGK
jgi:hypothetical protein